MNALFDQIVDIVEIFDDPAYSELPAVQKVLHVSGQVSSALLEIVGALKDGDMISTQELIDALEMLYAKYIKPIDLPLNDFVEMIVDNQVPKAIEPLVLALQGLLSK